MADAPAGIQRLWAGWRLPYIEDGGAPTTDGGAAGDRSTGSQDADPSSSDRGLTLFESILASGLPDRETYIVWRGETCFAILNLYPYANGHLMVLPQRGVATLAELTADEFAELWEGVRAAVAAIESAYRCDGVNVGLNLGEGAGAGVPDHLHVHVLPRWRGDTNFTVTVAELKVLPESLDSSWERLHRAWQ